MCVVRFKTMTWIWCLGVVLVAARFGVRAEKVLGVETDEFDFDGLPGAHYEFKVDVGGGRDDCYYQRIPEGGNIYVSFEVLRGGDMEIKLFLIDPDTEAIVQSAEKAIRGGFQYESPEEKTYGVCLDNTDSRMASKLVYLLVVSFKNEDWDQYSKEIEEVELTVGNFTNSIGLVQDSVTAARMHQSEMRMHILKDWYSITGKDTLIKRWSILQCLVIACSSCFQVYFVRRLFRNVNVVPKRPKA